MINHPKFFNQANGQKRFVCSLRKIVKTVSILCFLFIFLSGINPVNVFGQDTEPTPPAEEKPKAEEEKPAAAPEPKSTPLGGTVEGSDKIQIEPKIQSYRSVKDITRDIADDIYQFKPDAKRFVLYRADDYKTWQHYRLNKNRLETQMDTLICHYEIWISLAKTAFETNPRGETRRKMFADIPDGESCAPYRDVIGASPEIREFRRIIMVEDDERLGFGLMREELEDLTKQINANNTELQNLITRQKNAGRISLKDKRRKNDLLDRKLFLDQQFRDRQTELARREKNIEPTDPSYIEKIKEDDSTRNNLIGFFGAAAGAISPVTSLVGTAIDLISYFRSDISFSGATVSNKDKVARFNIANALQTRYCLGDTKKHPLISKDQKFDKKDERRIAERRAGIKLITESCTVDVYDPDLYTPDIVYSGRTSNGVDADGKSLPPGIEWMADLTDLRERSRVAIAAYDFQTTRMKNLATKITALDTAIAADDTAIKGYTDTLITLIEKGKVDKPVKAKKNQEKGMVETAFDNIKQIIDRANEARDRKIKERTKAQSDLDAIKIPGHLSFVADNLKAINTAFDKFNEAFTKIDDKTGLSPQMLYERAARLDAMFSDSLADNKSYWLDITTLEMEGTTRVRKNLFRYFYYPDISHNGGSVVQYSLSDPSGRVLLSNTDYNLRKYQKSSNVAKPQ